MKTHTNRAMEYLEAIGWLSGIVERKVARTVVHDLYGFADILAVNENEFPSTLAVQVTDHSHVSARLKKLLAEPNVIRCLKAGWRVEVWGIRDTPDRQGKYLKARTLVWEDEQLRVDDGSLVLDV